jgi:hypothetical protein
MTWTRIHPHRACTAPVDENVLVVAGGVVRIATYSLVDTDDPYMRWYEQCGSDPNCPLDDEPTHWMPLPDLPPRTEVTS